MNKKFARYNDGVVAIYKEKSRQTTFGARQNVNVLADMDFQCKLDYEEMSKREQDLNFAEQMGFSLSMKIKTRSTKFVDNDCKAVINGYLYDIKYVDKTNDGHYIFLEGVKKL